ncbi:hypothetical protein [Nocardioides terrisoli]|uniref:hypothetical protein n=1 Tax=Nocardioides terrisoli TaxID=3388267 RepID=UPI00287B8A2E|nr:hypothetical protein [Nocardioides marmorisolisilvae]
MDFDAFAHRLVLGAAAVAACLMPAQNDTWWQLRAGADIWRTGTIPLVDHHSLTAAGRDWPDHEWLWQAAAYAVHAVGGMPLLTAVNAAMAIAALIVVRRLAPARGRVGIIVLVLVIPLLSAEWTLRPQVATLLFFAVTLSALAHDRFLVLPPLFLIWANVHAGVAAGGLLLVLVTGTALIVHARSRTVASRGRTVRVGLVTAVCALLTLLNPLGPVLWRYVLSSPSTPGRSSLQEFHTAFHLDPVSIGSWIFIAATAAAVVTRRDRFASWPNLLLPVAAIGMSALTIVAARNVALLMLVALPTLIVAFCPADPGPRDVVPAARQLLGCAALVGCVVVALSWAQPLGRLGWNPISPAAQRAVRQCPEPLYNTYAEGGPLLWFVPQVPVFIDSRFDPYPSSVVLEDRHAEASGDYRPLFTRWRIRCAVVPPGSAIAGSLRSDGWRQQYADADWAVLLRPVR